MNSKQKERTQFGAIARPSGSRDAIAEENEVVTTARVLGERHEWVLASARLATVQSGEHQADWRLRWTADLGTKGQPLLAVAVVCAASSVRDIAFVWTVEPSAAFILLKKSQANK